MEAKPLRQRKDHEQDAVGLLPSLYRRQAALSTIEGRAGQLDESSPGVVFVACDDQRQQAA